MSSREHPISVTADMLTGGRPLHARWRTPARYGIAEHPRDGTPLLIVSEAVPRGETGALWVGYVLTPPHDGQQVEWAPLGCFVVDEDAWAAMMAPHLAAIRVETEHQVREADAAHRRQKARDLSALLRGGDTPDPRLTPTANRGPVGPTDPISADLLERARAIVRERYHEKHGEYPVPGSLAHLSLLRDAEPIAKALAAERAQAEAARHDAWDDYCALLIRVTEKATRAVTLGPSDVLREIERLGQERDQYRDERTTARAEIERLTREVEEGRRKLVEAEARGMERAARYLTELASVVEFTRNRVTAHEIEGLARAIRALRTPNDTTPRGSGEEK
jgi:hypothetical protein